MGSCGISICPPLNKIKAEINPVLQKENSKKVLITMIALGALTLMLGAFLIVVNQGLLPLNSPFFNVLQPYGFYAGVPLAAAGALTLAIAIPGMVRKSHLDTMLGKTEEDSTSNTKPEEKKIVRRSAALPAPIKNENVKIKLFLNEDEAHGFLELKLPKDNHVIYPDKENNKFLAYWDTKGNLDIINLTKAKENKGGTFVVADYLKLIFKNEIPKITLEELQNK